MRFRKLPSFAVVPMPETSMHENGLLLSGYYQVWFSWQVTRAAAISDAHSSHHPAHNQLGPCSAGADATHYLTASLWSNSIHIRMTTVGQNLDCGYHFGNLLFPF